MKRVLSFLLCLTVILLSSVFAAAEEIPLICDYGEILTYEEELLLDAQAATLQKQYGFDVVILTLESLDGYSIQDYADGYYDAMGYSEHGMILVLSMYEREWYISTCGDVIYALTDYGIGKLGDEMVPYLSTGNYFAAFDGYLQLLPGYFDAFLSGIPVDGYADYSGEYYHADQEDVVYYDNSSEPNVMMSVIIGLAVAAIAVLIMRSSMNSKQKQSGASSYLKKSYCPHPNQDLFLYRNVSKTRIQQSSGTGGHGGGSSVHRSTGGRSHGGGGGRF